MVDLVCEQAERCLLWAFEDGRGWVDGWVVYIDCEYVCMISFSCLYARTYWFPTLDEV